MEKRKKYFSLTQKEAKEACEEFENCVSNGFNLGGLLKLERIIQLRRIADSLEKIERKIK